MRGGCAPSALPRAGAPREHGLAMLGAPGVFAELIAPAPTMRALRPAPRVTFSPMRKSPKNLPEGVSPSGYSPWGALSSPQQRKRCSPQKGEKLRAARKLHNPPAAPRIDSRGCDPGVALGEKQDRFAHLLKVANLSIFVAEALLGGCGNAAGGTTCPPSGGPGAQPRHAFGSFRRETKGTPGVGRVGPPMGAVGAEGPHFGECRGA